MLNVGCRFPLYRRYGFEVLQDLDVDLRKWIEGEDSGYGIYRFRFMVRLPKSLGEALNMCLS